MYLGETCGFPRDPEPVYGVPVCCGDGSYSIDFEQYSATGQDPSADSACSRL